nr:MAG TPA: hypothetical protein [Caudoviricetes sp.]
MKTTASTINAIQPKLFALLGLARLYLLAVCFTALWPRLPLGISLMNNSLNCYEWDKLFHKYSAA